jgi:arginyl-tRNA synthetase
LKKLKTKDQKLKSIGIKIEDEEKVLLLSLSKFDEAIKNAANDRDPSLVAKYLFDLAQVFNNFYQLCPVLQAGEETKHLRLQLILKTKETMVCGLELLGIKVVEEM